MYIFCFLSKSLLGNRNREKKELVKTKVLDFYAFRRTRMVAVCGGSFICARSKLVAVWVFVDSSYHASQSHRIVLFLCIRLHNFENRNSKITSFDNFYVCSKLQFYLFQSFWLHKKLLTNDIYSCWNMIYSEWYFKLITLFQSLFISRWPFFVCLFGCSFAVLKRKQKPNRQVIELDSMNIICNWANCNHYVTRRRLSIVILCEIYKWKKKIIRVTLKHQHASIETFSTIIAATMTMTTAKSAQAVLSKWIRRVRHAQQNRISAVRKKSKSFTRSLSYTHHMDNYFFRFVWFENLSMQSMVKPSEWKVFHGF